MVSLACYNMPSAVPFGFLTAGSFYRSYFSFQTAVLLLSASGSIPFVVTHTTGCSTYVSRLFKQVFCFCWFFSFFFYTPLLLLLRHRSFWHFFARSDIPFLPFFLPFWMPPSTFLFTHALFAGLPVFLPYYYHFLPCVGLYHCRYAAMHYYRHVARDGSFYTCLFPTAFARVRLPVLTFAHGGQFYRFFVLLLPFCNPSCLSVVTFCSHAFTAAFYYLLLVTPAHLPCGTNCYRTTAVLLPAFAMRFLLRSCHSASSRVWLRCLVPEQDWLSQQLKHLSAPPDSYRDVTFSS